MATIQEIAKVAGVSATTVSCVLRNKPPFSERTRQKVMAAVTQLEQADRTEERVTIRDVANLTGVSISTVSNVVNGYPVSDEIRKKVEQGIAQLQYVPNMMGRGLRKERGMCIIVAVSNPHWRALQGIYAAATELNCEVILMHAGINSCDDYACRLDNGMAQGILFFDFFDEAAVERFGEKYHVIQCGGCTGAENVSEVCNDYISAGRELTQQLISLGKRRINVILGQSRRGEPVTFLKRFYRGTLQALEAAGIPKSSHQLYDWGNQIFLTTDYSLKDQFVKHLLGQPREQWPEAIITPNGESASMLIQALRSNGVSVPDDMLVAAYMSWETHRSTYPYVTSMQIDWYPLGYESVRQLITQIQTNDRTPKVISMPYSIVLSGSTHPELYPFGEQVLEK